VAGRPASGAPGAPWHSHVDALLWFARAPAGARARLPRPLAAGAWPAVTVGGLISYRGGPVGPYREAFAAPVLLRRGLPVAHVAFMAVDSAAALAGGRANWALPKVLAQFAADPAPSGPLGARGAGWALAATVRVRRRGVPVRAALPCAQVWPDGVVRRFVVRVRGRARPAVLALDGGEPLGAAGLPPWLTAGRHPAVLLRGALDVGPPRA
jgi:hypothetical protein